MNETKDGGPAFPIPEQHGQQYVGHPAHGMAWEQDFVPAQPGLSLRDWFAGQAIVGLAMDKNPADMIAEWAYALADAMLEARTQ